MTREEKLYSMTMACLAEVAKRLNVKIDKKGAKAKAVEKILLAEELNKQNEKELAKEQKECEAITKQAETAKKTKAVKEVKKPEEKPATPTKPALTISIETADAIREYIISKAQELGAELFTPSKDMKMRAFKLGGHVFAKIFYSKNRVSMFCRTSACKEAPDKTINNYTLNGQYILTPGCDMLLIDSLLIQSIEWQTAKNSKHNNTKKEEK